MGPKKHSTEVKVSVSESTPLPYCEVNEDTSSFVLSMILWPPYIHLASEIKFEEHIGDLRLNSGAKDRTIN